MAYVDIDFVVPIALLVASVVGVVLVRLAASRGEHAAKARTRALIDRFAPDRADGTNEGDGMRDADHVSSE